MDIFKAAELFPKQTPESPKQNQTFWTVGSGFSFLGITFPETHISPLKK